MLVVSAVAMASQRVHAIARAMSLTNVGYVAEVVFLLGPVTVMEHFLLRITIAQEIAWLTRMAMEFVMHWKSSDARMQPTPVTMLEPRKMTVLVWLEAVSFRWRATMTPLRTISCSTFVTLHLV
jgi:hypothetical protein